MSHRSFVCYSNYYSNTTSNTDNSSSNDSDDVDATDGGVDNKTLNSRRLNSVSCSSQINL